MRRRERFGKLVLLDELEAVHLGTTLLAARLGTTGLDRIVTLVRFSPKLSAHPDVAARLMDQTRRAARLGLRGLVQVLGIGRVGAAYYASCQLIEGRSLRAVIERSRQEGFPFSVENALMVASRAAAVLQGLHERKDDEGRSLFHGLLTPVGLVVSWEGEVRVREVGLWEGLRGSPLVGEIEPRALAPEQRDGGEGDARSDVHALGVILLEMLTGWSPDEGPAPLDAVSGARITVTGEEEPLPPPIREILSRALAPEPSQRHQDMAELRQAIDSLLFSGDFSPTTFNLAFFMQTLFREDMESEAKTLAEARGADYGEFLPPPAQPAEPRSAARPAPVAQPAPAAIDPAPARQVAPVPAEEASVAPVRLTAPLPSPEAPPTGLATQVAPAGEPSPPSSSGRRPHSTGRRPASLPPSASGRLLASAARGPGPPRGTALAGGVLLALLVGGVGGYVYFNRAPAADAQAASSLSPEEQAALSRVRQLEEALTRLEREKAELEAELEASGSADGSGTELRAAEPAVDVAAVSRAVPEPDSPVPDPRAEERRRARAEKARREEQIRRLEEEIRVSQELLVAEQGGGGAPPDLDVAVQALPASLPTPEPPPPTPPPVVAGQLVDAADPEVSGPELLDKGPEALLYPSAAKQWRRSAEVTVEALVGEDGQVLRTRVLESSVEGMGFEAAAERKVQLFRYRPASKEGVPVRVWTRVLVRFTP